MNDQKLKTILLTDAELAKVIHHLHCREMRAEQLSKDETRSEEQRERWAERAEEIENLTWTIERQRANQGRPDGRTVEVAARDDDTLTVRSASYQSAFKSGGHAITVQCNDFDHFETLPKSVTYRGVTLALTGWNSDYRYACYQEGAEVARRARRTRR